MFYIYDVVELVKLFREKYISIDNIVDIYYFLSFIIN